jgi:hypothetical protein
MALMLFIATGRQPPGVTAGLAENDPQVVGYGTISHSRDAGSDVCPPVWRAIPPRGYVIVTLRLPLFPIRIAKAPALNTIRRSPSLSRILSMRHYRTITTNVRGVSGLSGCIPTE